ncbi:hypothetical protein FOA52_013386 [Chlamydomonas sp. UWO 241]|nr:hypothetical protein FOA52_013386 [Chlamydomonas sp. UWO 241]
MEQRNAAPISGTGRRWIAPAGRLSAALPRSRLGITCSAGKHRVVFLGTPEVAASVLQGLYRASQAEGSMFEVTAVVSQPGKPKGRGNSRTPVPTPVEQAAWELGLPADEVLCPASAREGAFLDRMRELAPDLCITAAYGNMLPRAFLDIPRLGTLNVHPSLLPRYRGAAPVQRAVEDGVAETGVSVAYTVLACDAGPVLAQETVALDPDIQAPELLALLFQRGTALLVDRLPGVFEGRGPSMASAQDEASVLHAAKLRKEDAALDFTSCTAQQLHNKVRAFAGWPGTTASFRVEEEASGAHEVVEVKVLRTRVADAGTAPPPDEGGASWGQGDVLLLACAGGSVLEVLQVQPPTKKPMGARDFRNGLRGKRLSLAAAALSVS